MSLRNLRMSAELVGAAIVGWSSGDYEGFHVEAPDGKRWVDGGVMSLRVEWRTGEKQYKADAIADAVQRVSCGLRDATPEEREEEDLDDVDVLNALNIGRTTHIR